MSNRRTTGRPPAARPGPRAAGPPAGTVLCLDCVVLAKVALTSGDQAQAPHVAAAVTWAPGPDGYPLPVCFDHLQITQASGLVDAGGRPRSRLLT